MPTRSQRRDFLLTYVNTFSTLLGHEFRQEDLDALFNEVDVYRGAPGFYWGIWALIQATISQIDFDYANYAEIRLGEYWAWKRAHLRDGTSNSSGSDGTNGQRSSQLQAQEEPPLRERRWHSEE